MHRLAQKTFRQLLALERAIHRTRAATNLDMLVMVNAAMAADSNDRKSLVEELQRIMKHG